MRFSRVSCAVLALKLRAGGVAVGVVVAAFARAGSGGAVGPPRIGTPSSGITSRVLLDGYQNFAIVDTGQVAPEGGWLTQIEYYAQATGTIRFLLLDGSNVVRWESDPVTVTSTGAATDVLSTPAAVGAGWQLGYYTAGTGVIPYTPFGGPL